MTHHATVRNGALVLEEPVALPEGSHVEVELRPAISVDDDAASDKTLPTLSEQLADLIGSAPGLPPDLAENHDRYLYGRDREIISKSAYLP
jgi:hypothetical protein